MTAPSIVHGSFTIERSYPVAPARVFAAWAEQDAKARWFIGPPERWTLLERSLDFRVGGSELLRGRFHTTETLYRARFHTIVENERIVYAYDMWHGGRQLSVSLASVELAAQGRGCAMTYTEQTAFLQGEDGSASRQIGTAEHFLRLEGMVGDPHEIVSSRLLAAPRERVYAAFSEPQRLMSWWGPTGVVNELVELELKPGGSWRFVMVMPDGTRYPTHKTFSVIEPNERVVVEEPSHPFTHTMTFVDLGQSTLLIWRLRFQSAEEATRLAGFIVDANEQNFDRLAAHLALG